VQLWSFTGAGRGACRLRMGWGPRASDRAAVRAGERSGDRQAPGVAQAASMANTRAPGTADEDNNGGLSRAGQDGQDQDSNYAEDDSSGPGTRGSELPEPGQGDAGKSGQR
jgi:hypothetical protein